MKKVIIFLIVVFLIILSYIFMFNKKMNYKLEYEVNGYKVSEEYNKDTEFYTFILNNRDNEYKFMTDNKYSTKRKLIKEANIKEVDKYKCATIKVFGDFLPSICYDCESYVDSYISQEKNNPDTNKINTINDIDIYNKDYNYFIWNGYGLTNILTSKKYNFLKNEHYENDISIRFNDYIIFADYDQSREYSKLYIFNYKKLKIEEFEFEYKISTDSYFNGFIDNDIYLFDRKNKCQYKIDIFKKKISISSTNDYAISYDSKLDEERLSDFIYSNVLFKKEDLVNYYIKDKNLYYKYYKTDKDILINKGDIKDIIYVSDGKVFYLIEDSLYCYDLYRGNSKLLTYFEWNFSYKKKIYIF